MRRMVMTILVENVAGVLSRVAGLFSRRGYNIDSLTVSETQNPKYSRMTVAVTGDEQILEQIKNQLNKLEDVKDIKELADTTSVHRELILVKIEAKAHERQSILAVCDIFRAKVVDVGQDTIMVEITGNQAKMEAFMKLMDDYNIVESVRTGITGLARGSEIL
ncbi:MAG: acetolactate synthase small subunit [Lachnospiraceae bacterium]|nr:acetolactate synthase small subunit [Lachnospiraceae bacterium]